jgi:glucosylceramidase
MGLTMKITLLFLLLLCSSAACCAQEPSRHDRVIVYTTAEHTEYRLARTDEKQFVPAGQPVEADVCVFVNPGKTFQVLLGIGGALTDAAAEVFARLPAARQQELLTAYYDPEKGIGYALARTSIHSCDFSSESYTYIDEGDRDLKTFSIQHDRRYRIPLIKRAMSAAGGRLTLFASAWSPPAFMKDNASMVNGGKLLPAYYGAWALYITKFIKAYEAENIPVWGVTVQNEPMAVQKFESCIYTAEEERDFLKQYLGPTMVREGLGDKKIIVWDHNRNLMHHRVNVIYGDPEASKYAWGTGFHWYETWTGDKPMFDNVKAVYESYPSKGLLLTEACVGNFDPGRYQYWPNAEQYGNSMIHDFNNGSVGWTDWNILLDEEGGPNHVGNFCFAPVHASTATGELIFTPSYYYIGHFSKFIRPGAKRVSTTCSQSLLQSTSFVNTDGSIITVVINQSDDPVAYKLIAGSNSAELTIPARGIQTLVY